MTGSQTRRAALQKLAGLPVAACASSWLPRLAMAAAGKPVKKRCIMLWMAGGASQTDTFDMKPGHANGGEFKEIDTNVSGIRISEHLPRLSKHADKMAIVRSMQTKEGDHGRGTYLMRTGHTPGGPIAYPTVGSLISKELGSDKSELPNFIAISPYVAFNPAAYSPGFLGPKYAPATVGSINEIPAGDDQPTTYAELGLDDLKSAPGVTADAAKRRHEFWNKLQAGFLQNRETGASLGHDTVYRRAMRMLSSDAVGAFDLTKESDDVRDQYGAGRFGQGCLMARRLIERDVPFVEVTLGFEAGNQGWDTHQNNFPSVKTLSEQLDQGWSALMTDLEQRGLLESTTILWMGEFGRTPTINGNAGRDHFPNAWTCVMAGGGVKGGQTYGKTNAGGTEIVDNPVNQEDLLATLCEALEIDPSSENMSPIGRPFQISEGIAVSEIVKSTS